MKDKLPQYDEDFQLDMVNMSYGVAICLGALVYLVFLFVDFVLELRERIP